MKHLTRLILDKLAACLFVLFLLAEAVALPAMIFAVQALASNPPYWLVKLAWAGIACAILGGICNYLTLPLHSRTKTKPKSRT